MIYAKLPKTAEKVILTLKSSGFEAYAVGGCVRDMIMGKTPADYDVTTNALPSEIKAVFRNYKTIDIGIKHGTVCVVADGTAVEITTYRTDGKYTDNRHPDKVVFSDNLHDDLCRRDFTVNALAYDGSQIIDEFGGVDDINRMIIKCVGNPQKRFEEDALRILRAVRFSSVLGFEIEYNTKKAIFNSFLLLDNISKERIFSEIQKMFCGENVKNVLAEYKGMFEYIFGDISSYSVEEYEVSACMVSLSENNICMRLAAFLYFLPLNHAESILNKLKCSKKMKNEVMLYIKRPNIDALNDFSQIRKYMFFEGEHQLKNSLELCLVYSLCISDFHSVKKINIIKNNIDEILKLNLCYKISHLKINGSHICNANLASGNKVGAVLKSLLFAVIDGKVENEKNALLEYSENNLI